jgi:solute carrier family 25 citrate transporter 1
MTRQSNTSVMMNLVAGGGAGAMESLVCHPLDTIKTRLQLQRDVGVSPLSHGRNRIM